MENQTCGTLACVSVAAASKFTALVTGVAHFVWVVDLGAFAEDGNEFVHGQHPELSDV